MKRRSGGVERLGIALEPEADYERGRGGGAARILASRSWNRSSATNTYTAFSPKATDRPGLSVDLFRWQRVGWRILAGITTSRSAM